MPPSPALRCSPGREHRMESTHRRGRSFERGATLKAKDDDLALFNDMQNRERDNFLLHDSDDVDDSLSKLKYLSNYNLGVNIPARGERSDILKTEGEKNDYDWLLTPPDTPLFRSLDDDEPQPHLLPRGRPRSQPIKVLRSSLSMTEKTHRMSRSSSSPRRLSPSPRSSVTQLKAKPSSAPRASPPPALRPATSSERPSTPPPALRPVTSSQRPTPANRTSSPTPRSLTPTLRRTSTCSSVQASSSGRRPASPMNSSRGNSASPKLRGWQSDFLGFSSDAPPNLRTSLSDRPVPHVRGMSPSPIRGRGRQSMSPTASRSSSLSHSQERDHISSFSKGSIASSGDDDVDSLQSVAISSSPPVRRNGMSVNNKPMAYSKKTSRSSSASSLPKRSFESVLRQMEHRKTPQNMFRPLLSSVPATTFYVGKVNSSHRPMFSRNSSLTTSTSASSDQGASVAPDMEGSEHDHNDLPGEWQRTEDPGTHEEMFIFDKSDSTTEDCGDEDFAGMPYCQSGSFSRSTASRVGSHECKSSMVNIAETASSATVGEPPCATSYCSVVDGCEIMAVCSKCGKRFKLVGLNGDTDTDTCEECEKIDQLFLVEPLMPINVTLNEMTKSDSHTATDRSCNEVQVIGLCKSPEKSSSDGQHQLDIQQGPNCLDENCPVQSVTDQSKLHLFDHQLDKVSVTQSDSGSRLAQIEYTANSSLRVDNPEGTGISVLLLQRSSSSKWPVVQGRSFSSTNILCSEPSYVRENTIALRRSIGQDSASTSSSMDLGSSRQLETRIQRQFSSRKNEMGSIRSETDAKEQCTSSHPDLIIGTYETSIHPNSETEDNFNDSTKSMIYEAVRESIKDTDGQENYFDHSDTKATVSSSSRLDLVDESIYAKDHSCMKPNTSDTQLPDHSESVYCDSLPADSLKDETCFQCINAEEDPLKTNERSTHDVEVPNDVPDTSVIVERYVTNDPACRSVISDAATDSHSVVILEPPKQDSFQEKQTECMPSQIPTTMEVPNEHSASTTSEKGVSDSTSESRILDHDHGVHEESTVIVEGPNGHTSRSLTLAEATDSILFCSSIVHDIAFRAATIGMEKELTMTPATSRPTIMIVGKSVLDEKDSGRMPNKGMPKSQKPKRKKPEVQTHSPPTESEKNVILQGPAPPNAEVPNKAADSMKPPKLESKCNCTVM
ncbi:uncharacterized protein M6B38_393250 [Iris pallida]|uniref:Uncharacterized protein n=1 Tax=Iris pallida TaxID=29817 RepID=A0AAX6FXP4_IRIPA|nr:uncharacterized protein M6B38_393250 [Iris pallida]